jgi:hypothetical protein
MHSRTRNRECPAKTKRLMNSGAPHGSASFKAM